MEKVVVSEGSLLNPRAISNALVCFDGEVMKKSLLPLGWTRVPRGL